jgi:hypothetical protein
MNMGDWEMKLYDEIEQTDPSIRRWYNDYMHLAATGGENFPQLYARVAAFPQGDKSPALPPRSGLCSWRACSSVPASTADCFLVSMLLRI